MVEYRHEAFRLVCAFQGKMDTVTAMRLENGVDIEVRRAKLPVVFDLSGVDYVSSSFIRVCAQTARTTGKERFAIANASAAVRIVLRVAGLEGFLKP